jgi:outer membrane lipoprotein SlyB
MSSIVFRFSRQRAGAHWFVAAGAAAAFSAAALTACSPRDVPADPAATASADATRPGTPVPPAPTAALAPAPAVAPSPPPLTAAPAPQVALAPMPQPSGYPATGPQPVPPAATDDLARPEPAPVSTRNARVAQRATVPSTTLGTIDRIEPITQRPQGNGTGAVIGGVAGAVIGNQFGHGLGRAAMTGLGAAGGAVAGNNVERNVRKTVVGYRVHVRLDDGSTRTFERSNVGDLHAGDRVRVGRDGLHRA